MLLEQCRPPNGGTAECGGFFVVALQTGFASPDGSQSAGTTSPEAGQGQVPPFCEDGQPCA